MEKTEQNDRERVVTRGVVMEFGRPATRWTDLQPDEIATVAHHQINGNFGPVSDALTALHLIEAIAHRLKEAALTPSLEE